MSDNTDPLDGGAFKLDPFLKPSTYETVDPATNYKKPNIGRPTKFNQKMHEELLEMASQGLSVTQACAFWGIARDTFYDWVRTKKSFSDTALRARQLCEAYWEDKSQALALMGSNAGMMKFMMNVRFGWREVTEQKTDFTSGGNPVDGIPVIVAAEPKT